MDTPFEDAPNPRDTASSAAMEENVWLARANTIEQRYELAITLADLGLEHEIGIAVGSDHRFVIRQLIGLGSLGAVYLAEDAELDRRVAIKIMSKRLGRGGLELRLRREARALAALDHPNVVKIFDIGKDGDEPFIAMEYVAGRTLREWQQSRGIGDVLDAYLQAGQGLAAAHDRGLVHHDFKPDNVLVDEHEGRLRVRVSDFGLAGDDPERSFHPNPSGSGSRSPSMGLVGTLAYMAPEQLRREQAGARSDQHQFCVALWEAVAGARPFDSRRLLTGSTAVPGCPSAMPRWLHRVLRRGLAFEPEARWPSMAALLAAIERGRFLQRLRLWLVVGGLAAIVASASWQATHPDPCAEATEPMAKIWTDAARADIAATFGKRDAEHGGTVTEYLVDRLDQAAKQWSERALDACRAHAEAPAAQRPEIERRITCIERWAQRIESRIEWLRHPDEVRIEQAFELIAPLALAGESCSVPPIMIDANVDAAIERAEQAELLRDFDGALAVADEAVDLAKIHGSPCPITSLDQEVRSSELAAAYHRLGHVLSERGDALGSYQAFRRAHDNAYACGDLHRNAVIASDTAKVLALDLDQADEASREINDAWASLEQLDEPAISLRRYEVLMAAGIVANSIGQYELARDYSEKARDALGDEAVAEPILQAKLDINIGIAWQNGGDYAEAAASNNQAVQRIEEALGRDHPQARLYAARRHLNLGLAAQERGATEEMRQSFAKARNSSEAHIVTKALTAWAQGEFTAGDEEAAKARATELLEFLDHDLPSVTLAVAETTAGQILAFSHDPTGIPILERACARWDMLEARDQLITCEVSLVQALLDAGQRQAAQDRHSRLLGYLQEAPPERVKQAIEDLSRILGPGRADPSNRP